ncbi:MAG: ABC transporter ATP-binding protein [Alphaproteobacteria bacterium]|nr:ABC transporter ATP-binding protein [Alphaproteobacteria bacterium]
MAPLVTDRPDALRLDGVSVCFGDVFAIRETTLAVRDGEVMCLLGPSGCGKSTLLRSIAGIEPLAAGRVAIGGREVAAPGVELPPEARGIGFVFQDFALFPHLSVFDNVAFGLSGLPRAERKARAAQALDQTGVRHLGRQFPHTLSGGQQQRVALARALAPGPRLLLLDEPFSGLDARLRDQVRDDCLRALRATGVTAVMVTHDPEEAMLLADRIAIMRGGAIVQVGDPETLYFRPVDPFVAETFSEVNRLLGVVRGGAVETVLGVLPVAGIAEHTAVLVLVRPEAIMLADEDAGAPEARVESARLLGRASLLGLCIEAPEVGTYRFKARVSGRFLPVPGSRIRFRLDPARVHVFPSATTVDPGQAP